MMKNIKYYFLFLALILIGLPSCEISNGIDPDNPNPENTDDPVVKESKVIWSSDLSIPINPALGGNYMPAVDENDNIYVLMQDWVDSGYVIQKFDKNGQLKWTKTDKENSPFQRIVTYYNNKLYYSTHNKIFCLNASNGEEAWSYIPADSLETTYSMVIADGNLITVMSGIVAEYSAKYSHIFSLNPDNGAINDTYPIGWRGIVCAIAANASTVYVTYNKLHSFSIKNGQIALNWEVLLPKNTENYDDTYTNIFSDIVINPSNQNIYFTYGNLYSYGDEWIVAYDKTGSKLWESDLHAKHLIVDSDNALYACSSNLYKLNGNNGDQLWETKAPAKTLGLGSFLDVTLGEDKILYSGDTYGLYGVNSQGETKLSASPDEIIGVSSPLSCVTFLSNGNIIVLAMAESDEVRSKIYCVESSSKGIKSNAWAKWGGNASNTFNLMSGN